MPWTKEDKAKFRKGFTKQDQTVKSNKPSFQERHRARMAKMSASEKAARARKIAKEKAANRR